MRFKKGILVFIFFTGLLGCDCFYGGSEWNISNFEVLIVDQQDSIPSNGIIEGDSAKLHITFEPEFLSLYSNPLNELMNSAYATTCVEEGNEGLDDSVESLLITSNSDFNDIPAGASLNELLVVNRDRSIKDWISESTSWMFEYNQLVQLTFIERPEIGSNHIFTLKFTMESGNIIEQETEAIQWN